MSMAVPAVPSVPRSFLAFDFGTRRVGVAAGLAKATGVLRSKVGAGTGVRFTPTLTFVRDSVPDAARHMEELVARARANDLAVAQQAAAAQPAGEADPYRHDDEDGRTE